MRNSAVCSRSLPMLREVRAPHTASAYSFEGGRELEEAVKDLSLVPEMLVMGLSWYLDMVGRTVCDLKRKV